MILAICIKKLIFSFEGLDIFLSFSLISEVRLELCCHTYNKLGKKYIEPQDILLTRNLEARWEVS